MAMVTAHAHDAGAKLILVGDDRQLSSIDRGGMFGALKDRHGAAALSEVKRQHKLDERRAAEWMAEGNYHDALNVYDRKGAIHWTRTQGEARVGLVQQWTKDSATAPDKTRFVFAYTNDDVNQLNAALRAVRVARGELGEDHEIETAHGRSRFGTGDRILFTGTDKKLGIANGHAGTIEAIDDGRITVRLDSRQEKSISFDPAAFDKFRHGYAGTIYKSQGKTLDQTYLYHSEHWRSAASYVALTRHRDKTELFVATNTAKDVTTLARQMGRADDRRAASQFHYAQVIEAPPLTAAELHARFSADATHQRQEPPQPVAPAEAADDPQDIRQRRKTAMDAEQLGALKDHEKELENLEEIRKAKERQDDYLREWKDITDKAERAKEQREQEDKNRLQEGQVENAESRFAEASRLFDIRDPYASMVKVVTAEYAAYRESQDALKEQIAKEADPAQRHILEMKHDIQEADYKTLVHERLAGQSYVITGKRGYIDQIDDNGETKQVASQHQIDVVVANYWRDKAEVLREDLAAALGGRSDERAEAQKQGLSPERPAEQETGKQGQTTQQQSEETPERYADLRPDQIEGQRIREARLAAVREAREADGGQSQGQDRGGGRSF
jgi:hypothetical protein